MLKPFAALVVAALLPGCSVYRDATTSTLPIDVGWRSVATDPDRERMRNWRQAWDAALPLARGVDPAALAAGGALFDPDTAQPGGAPPPGRYRCRTFKLGAKEPGMPQFTAYPWFECSVGEGEVRPFEKVSGSQRPVGLLYPDSTSRAVFLGTLVLGDEHAPLRYGTDQTRNMIGYVERIGEARWRLVFPYPHFESLLDVVELVPAS